MRRLLIKVLAFVLLFPWLGMLLLLGAADIAVSYRELMTWIATLSLMN